LVAFTEDYSQCLRHGSGNRETERFLIPDISKSCAISQRTTACRRTDPGRDRGRR